MKKSLVTLMVAFSALSVVMADAEAKRMGGGSSVGKQSQSASRSALPPAGQTAPGASQAAPAAAKPAAPAAAPAGAAAKPASPWKGILGGALLGLGLGALLSHLGIGGALASMISTFLMIALLAVAGIFIYRMLRRRSEGGSPLAKNGLQPAYGGAGVATPEIGSRLEPVAAPAQPAALNGAGYASAAADTTVEQPAATWNVPADFDTQGFLRHAKTYFIRLQAAWDRADTNDLREFTAPEMFAELRMQLQERGASPNHTDVVSLDAELLGIEQIGSDYLASVRFTGLIKESEQAAAEPFTEIWNLSKPAAGAGGWVLAGIQQVH